MLRVVQEPTADDEEATVQNNKEDSGVRARLPEMGNGGTLEKRGKIKKLENYKFKKLGDKNYD